MCPGVSWVILGCPGVITLTRFVPACSKIPTVMPMGGVLGACSIIHIHHNLVFAIGRGSSQPLPFPYGLMFGIACLNDQINAVLLSAIRRDSGQPVQILKKTL